MTHVTCRLTAKNRDRLRNPTLVKRVAYGLPFVTNPNSLALTLELQTSTPSWRQLYVYAVGFREESVRVNKCPGGQRSSGHGTGWRAWDMTWIDSSGRYSCTTRNIDHDQWSRDRHLGGSDYALYYTEYYCACERSFVLAHRVADCLTDSVYKNVTKRTQHKYGTKVRRYNIGAVLVPWAGHFQW